MTIQPNDPFLGFPASVTDDVSGVALTSCQDLSGFCLETPAPDQTAPLSVPDNYTPDGEAFYNEADATVPGAGLGLALFALEQAFDVDPPAQGHQILFTRIRFRFTGLTPGKTYRVTHPFGVDEFVADGTGVINSTEDTGCFLVPNCPFDTVGYGRITSFLQWDPTVAPAAPAGYIGNVAVIHKVIGSPFATNFVRVEELSGPGGLVARLVGQTSDFHVQGKLAGPPPAPAPFPIADTSSLTYTSRQVGTTSAAKTVTITNHGTAALTPTAATLGGADAGDFQIAKDGCSGVTVGPAQGCAIDVVFAPVASGDRGATLSIADNSAVSPQSITLAGNGTPALTPAPPPVVVHDTSPAPAPVVIHDSPPPAFNAGALRVGRVSVARRVRLRAARRGIAVAFSAPAQANVVRLRLFRLVSGRRNARPVASKLVALARPGRQTLHLRAKSARPGRYVIDVTPGTGARAFGQVATAPLQIVR